MIATANVLRYDPKALICAFTRVIDTGCAGRRPGRTNGGRLTLQRGSVIRTCWRGTLSRHKIPRRHSLSLANRIICGGRFARPHQFGKVCTMSNLMRVPYKVASSYFPDQGGRCLPVVLDFTASGPGATGTLSDDLFMELAASKIESINN